MIDVPHACEYSMVNTPFSYSPLVQEDMLHLGQLSVYKDAAQTFTRFCAGQINPSQFQRVVQYYGSALGSVPEVELTTEGSSETAQYTMVDGSMVQTDYGWKEIKLGRHFSDKDIIGAGNERRREISRSVYHAQMTDCLIFTQNMDAILAKSVSSKSKHIFITDGALWIEHWIQKSYPDAISILDFYHGAEHVADGIKKVTDDVTEQQTLITEYSERLKAGGVLGVIKSLEQIAKESGKDIGGVLQYLRNNAYRMKYDEYLKSGFMIGSGAIEAAHRTVIQSRMKLSGQRWSIEGVHAMLKLRSRFESNKWGEVRKKILEINCRKLLNAA